MCMNRPVGDFSACMPRRARLVRVGVEVDAPLVGTIAYGIIDRGTNLLQIRPVSLCPLSCIFCSTDAGPRSRGRQAEYLVELDYLVEGLRQIAKFKGAGVEMHIDTVGEPLTYPRIVELVQALRDIPEVSVISMQSNGVLLTHRLVEELADAGLDRINLSIHALNPQLAKKLTGTTAYPLDHVLEAAEAIAQSRIDLLVAPVWVPNMNDDEIPKLIEYALRIGAGRRWPPLGVQKYLRHRRGRNPAGVRSMSWKTFYTALRRLERRYGVKLVLSPSDFGIVKRKMLPKVFRLGERVRVRVLASGWLRGEKLAEAKGVAITLVDADEIPVGSRVRARIIQNKHNIYLARPIP